MIDLILKDIEDPYVRENFFRLRNFLGSQVIFDGDFKVFDITIPGAYDKFPISHGLSFIPADIVSLAFEGNGNYYFRYQEFDRENLYITTKGEVRIRFLAGKLKDPVRASSDRNPYDFVAPGDVVAPASPGFVFAGVDEKTTGFWLTSEGIPSNVVGVPVMFSDAVVVQAAVGTETESNYTIAIYEHAGQGIGLTEIGRFDVIGGGPKRFDLEFPLIYASTNPQLACRLLTGNTKNLKVSFVVKGSAI